MIAVINSEVANLASVVYALERLNQQPVVTQDADDIVQASHVIFPGVGSASSAMQRLQQQGLDTLLPTLTQPVLGICLGMQLLYDYSEEGQQTGLGIIPGKIQRLPDRAGVIPHMGWNQLQLDSTHPLCQGISSNSHVFFVHSFAAQVDDYTLATTDYGMPFTAIVAKDNFFGMQFHPERSAAVGQQLLTNFLAL